jgi:uncharacterized protein YoxC
MSVGEWAAVIAAGASVAFVVVIGLVAASFRRALDELRKTLVDARRTINNVDPLLGDAQTLLSTVETVLKTPGVKAAAIASGLGRGVQHLREKLH